MFKILQLACLSKGSNFPCGNFECLGKTDLSVTSSIFFTSVLVYSARHGPLYPGDVQASMDALIFCVCHLCSVSWAIFVSSGAQSSLGQIITKISTYIWLALILDK